MNETVGWTALVSAAVAIGVIFPLKAQVAALREGIEKIKADLRNPGDNQGLIRHG
jgi:hypothetical protein